MIFLSAPSDVDQHIQKAYAFILIFRLYATEQNGFQKWKEIMENNEK